LISIPIISLAMSESGRAVTGALYAP